MTRTVRSWLPWQQPLTSAEWEALPELDQLALLARQRPGGPMTPPVPRTLAAIAAGRVVEVPWTFPAPYYLAMADPAELWAQVVEQRRRRRATVTDVVEKAAA
jgi:hypothetical protein